MYYAENSTYSLTLAHGWIVLILLVTLSAKSSLISLWDKIAFRRDFRREGPGYLLCRQQQLEELLAVLHLVNGAILRKPGSCFKVCIVHHYKSALDGFSVNTLSSLHF